MKSHENVKFVWPNLWIFFSFFSPQADCFFSNRKLHVVNICSVLVECKYWLLLCTTVKLSRFLSKTPEHDAHCSQVSGVFFNGLNYGYFFISIDIYLKTKWKIFLFFNYFWWKLFEIQTYHNSHFLVLSCLVRLVCVCPCLSFICIYNLMAFAICYPCTPWSSSSCIWLQCHYNVRNIQQKKKKSIISLLFIIIFLLYHFVSSLLP